MPGASRERMLELNQLSSDRRHVRAQIKAELQNANHRGISVAEALEHPLCQATPVYKFLTWPHGWKDRTSEQMMAKLQIKPSATVGELSPYQRRMIGRGKAILEVEDLSKGYCRRCGSALIDPKKPCGWCEAAR